MTLSPCTSFSPPPPPPTLELGYMHLSTPSPTDEDCRLSEPFLPCGHMCIQTNRHAGTNTHNFSHHPGIPWKLGMSAYRDKCCRSVDYFFADPDHIVADPYYFIANRIIFLPIRIITDSDKNLSRQLCLPQAASQQRPCKEQQLFQGFEPPQSPRRHLLSASICFL